tara:strand:+ start:49 stop:1146 length:1098 start_codon:yes stop_codon:yes gene_type:complete
MYKLLFEKFLQQFIKTFGRKPQTRKELMSIQDDVVRYLNKTKGVPEKKPTSPFQGFTPKVIQGGKSKEGITSIPVNKQIQDLKTFEREVIDELNAPIKPDLEVIKGGKKEGLAGIEQRAKKIEDINTQLKKALEERKAMLPGSKDKTLFKDSPEAIAKMKAENKAAIKRLKDKKKTVEDFKDDGDFDPGGMASGGIAGQLHMNRPGYAEGTREKAEKAILSTPPNVGGIMGDILSLYVQGVPKWMISKLTQGGVRSTLAKKYHQLAKENRLRDARQLLTAQDPYIGEDPAISDAKRTFLKYSRRVPTEEETEHRLTPEAIEEGWRYPGRGGRGVPHERTARNKRGYDSGGRVSLSNGGLANILGV